MEQKKNEKYDLEKKRPLFFGIGMIVSLSLTLVAFEWKSPIDPVMELSAEYDEFNEVNYTVNNHKSSSTKSPDY